ncbi:hypothetical protein SH1V18_26670 [Vallitalea longa]|uniref:Photosynthesis system II assembly factor Ycf48/Hcf136-like domain-containing protein n=1 Tax=Vallitalea longa TaxID=2936439 RepID=A0A9W5YA68_9FIRM|nr:hypothetical protein [Vallitalea longa]GKX30187.1 hypothetical protein SH1V18_26670 [Vallitalea longa]
MYKKILIIIFIFLLTACNSKTHDEIQKDILEVKESINNETTNSDEEQNKKETEKTKDVDTLQMKEVIDKTDDKYFESNNIKYKEQIINYDLLSLATNDELAIAVGEQGIIKYSYDGEKWDTTTTKNNDTLRNVFFFKNKIFITTINKILYTNLDDITSWETVDWNDSINKICYNENMIYVMTDESIIYRSIDGLNWEQLVDLKGFSDVSNFEIDEIFFKDNMLYAFGKSDLDEDSQHSIDTVKIFDESSLVETQKIPNLYIVKLIDNKFIGCSVTPLEEYYMYKSTDGLLWNKDIEINDLYFGYEGNFFKDIIKINDSYIVSSIVNDEYGDYQIIKEKKHGSNIFNDLNYASIDSKYYYINSIGKLGNKIIMVGSNGLICEGSTLEDINLVEKKGESFEVTVFNDNVIGLGYSSNTNNSWARINDDAYHNITSRVYSKNDTSCLVNAYYFSKEDKWYKTEDGVTWEIIKELPEHIIRDSWFNGKDYIFYSDTASDNYISNDLINFEEVAIDDNKLKAMVFNGEMYLGHYDGNIYISDDYKRWQQVIEEHDSLLDDIGNSILCEHPINNTIWTGSQFLIIGEKGVLMSKDGFNWELHKWISTLESCIYLNGDEYTYLIDDNFIVVYDKISGLWTQYKNDFLEPMISAYIQKKEKVLLSKDKCIKF